MAEAKTKPTNQTVKDFISKLPDGETRADCAELAKMMEAATGSKGLMWGASIAGYGTRKIKYAGGKDADWPLVAFSPRKQNLTLYLGLGDGKSNGLLAKLGKHKTSKGCLYIKRLSDVNIVTLRKVIEASVKSKKV